MKLIKKYKQINDPIHGYISLSNLACRIIDTIEFQRLRHLKQLGTCYYVFPSANHSRFEHSIGTYYLSGLLLENIKKNSEIDKLNLWMENINELNEYYKKKSNNSENKIDRLDNYVCELIKIAGLCHDLGHGPFSHIFDDVFIPSIRKDCISTELDKHEVRSGIILEHIIKLDENLSEMIGKNELEFIKNLINPKEEHRGFVYQIVSNNFNYIDVDKFDYLDRDTKTLGLKFGFDYSRLIKDALVLNNIICFPEQIYFEVASIFETRYRLHKLVYTHKVVISIQFMIYEMMKLIDPIVKIYDSINDITKFCILTDDYILSLVKFLFFSRNNYDDHDKELIIKAYDILTDINSRNLYKFIKTIVLSNEIDLEKIFQNEGVDLTNIIIHKIKIGFVSGKKNNPLDSLYFYKNKNPGQIYKIKKEQITYLISNFYQEYVYMVFIKNINKTNDEYLIKIKNILDLIQTK